MNWKNILNETWDKVVPLSEKMIDLFDKHFTKEKTTHEFDGWTDHFWYSDEIRKCHLKTIDHRESRKMWLMHINIFPQTNINLPIFGFDIVAGPKKITGAFLDYSNCRYHPYSDYMDFVAKKINWNKPRELPEWALNIFSSNMIAAGNIRGEEIDLLCHVAQNLTWHYVENIKENSFKTETDMTFWHNYYCANQKKNPHLHKSILAMGISEEDKERYVNNVLFEQI